MSFVVWHSEVNALFFLIIGPAGSELWRTHWYWQVQAVVNSVHRYQFRLSFNMLGGNCPIVFNIIRSFGNTTP